MHITVVYPFCARFTVSIILWRKRYFW